MSDISPSTIQALVEVYSLEQLYAKRRALIEQLASADMLTSASTGGGTSYTRQQRVALTELIDAYTAAIHHCTGEESANPSQVIDYIITGRKY